MRHEVEGYEFGSTEFFCFGRAWFRMKTHEQAWKFLRAWPNIVETALHHRQKVFEIEGVNFKITPIG